MPHGGSEASPAGGRRGDGNQAFYEVVAFLPIARTQFVGLQRIEHAQHFLWILPTLMSVT